VNATARPDPGRAFLLPICYTIPMSKTTITIRPSSKGRKLLVELDADKLERLASNLGFYNPDFLRSLERAERDYRAGRMHKVASLHELRRK
jgi:hypothetical protein